MQARPSQDRPPSGTAVPGCPLRKKEARAPEMCFITPKVFFKTHSKTRRASICHSSSIRSILKMTGLVPSEQQVIIVFSAFIHPRMMEPPCNPV